MTAPVFQHHPHRPLADLRCIPNRRFLLLHRSILSRIGASGKPGAVQTGWYRQGADVQRLLPVLSTYLGHADLEGTKVYLSMTPELLQQASLRFARYAGGGENV
jgi:hypothetical protein